MSPEAPPSQPSNSGGASGECWADVASEDDAPLPDTGGTGTAEQDVSPHPDNCTTGTLSPGRRRRRRGRRRRPASDLGTSAAASMAGGARDSSEEHATAIGVAESARRNVVTWSDLGGAGVLQTATASAPIYPITTTTAAAASVRPLDPAALGQGPAAQRDAGELRIASVANANHSAWSTQANPWSWQHHQPQHHLQSGVAFGSNPSSFAAAPLPPGCWWARDASGILWPMTFHDGKEMPLIFAVPPREAEQQAATTEQRWSHSDGSGRGFVPREFNPTESEQQLDALLDHLKRKSETYED